MLISADFFSFSSNLYYSMSITLLRKLVSALSILHDSHSSQLFIFMREMRLVDHQSKIIPIIKIYLKTNRLGSLGLIDMNI